MSMPSMAHLWHAGRIEIWNFRRNYLDRRVHRDLEISSVPYREHGGGTWRIIPFSKWLVINPHLQAMKFSHLEGVPQPYLGDFRMVLLGCPVGS